MKSKTYKNFMFALTFSSGLFMGGCASSNETAASGSNAPRTLFDIDGTFIAQPVHLVLVGLDDDRDLRLTRDEMIAGLDQEWGRADVDEDMELDAVEFATWAEVALGNQGAMPSRLVFDTDLSGSITQAEFMAYFGKTFNTLDSDKDGYVVRADMLRALPSISQMRSMQQRQPPQGMPPGGMPPGGRPPG